MRIEPDNQKLVYCGRIDWRDKKRPVFVFPCTSLMLRFTGNILKIQVENKHAYWENYLGYIADGKQGSVRLPDDKVTEIIIDLETNESSEHEVLFFKRQDSCHEVTIHGIEIADDGVLLEPPQLPERKIEVYGDSVSAGEVSEAVEYTGKADPEHNGQYSNSWYSYAWMTARKLDAQIHDIAQGGIAMMDHTGWFCEPEAVGMETAWDTIHYNPQLGERAAWDFTGYTPQVVIVAIGQNDSHPNDYMKENYEGENAKKWRTHYKAFLEKIRKQYTAAHIICCTTLLEHDPAWDKAIGQVVSELADKKITQYLFRRNGSGTPGHLRISEAEEMAEELSVYIENLSIEGWE